MKMEAMSKDKDGEIIGKDEYIVNPNSLKINRKVDLGKFTIPRSDAQTVINEDTGEVSNL